MNVYDFFNWNRNFFDDFNNFLSFNSFEFSCFVLIEADSSTSAFLSTSTKFFFVDYSRLTLGYSLTNNLLFQHIYVLQYLLTLSSSNNPTLSNCFRYHFSSMRIPTNSTSVIILEHCTLILTILIRHSWEYWLILSHPNPILVLTLSLRFQMLLLVTRRSQRNNNFLHSFRLIEHFTWIIDLK